jgi:hypothetical protein
MCIRKKKCEPRKTYQNEKTEGMKDEGKEKFSMSTLVLVVKQIIKTYSN